MCALLAPMATVAQTEVSHYTPGIHAEGVTYFLPATAIDVVIEAEKVTYTPGEFCHYAQKYLRLAGVSDKPDCYWEIKDIQASSVGIVDPAKGYTVKLKDKSVAPLVQLTEEGLLLAINRDDVKHAASEPPAEVPPVRQLNPKDYLGEEILSATSTAKMAELVAKEIYNIRESRNSIVRGQSDNMPTDGEGLKLVLKSLEEQDVALTSLFKGTTVREKKYLTLRLTPGEEQADRQVLFRFSRKLGIVGADDLSGAPVYYDMQRQTPLPQPAEGGTKKTKRPQGVVYNIPGKALFKVYMGDEVFVEQEYAIAQWGNTEVLSSELFNKNATTRVTFDPTTGGVVKIDRE